MFLFLLGTVSDTAEGDFLWTALVILAILALLLFILRRR